MQRQEHKKVRPKLPSCCHGPVARGRAVGSDKVADGGGCFAVSSHVQNHSSQDKQHGAHTPGDRLTPFAIGPGVHAARTTLDAKVFRAQLQARAMECIGEGTAGLASSASFACSRVDARRGALPWTRQDSVAGICPSLTGYGGQDETHFQDDVLPLCPRRFERMVYALVAPDPVLGGTFRLPETGGKGALH